MQRGHQNPRPSASVRAPLKSAVLRFPNLLVLACLLLAGAASPRSVPASAPRAWLSRPLLSYFALTASLAAPLRSGARLSPAEFAAVQSIARNEAEALRALVEESRPIVEDPSLSLDEKRAAVRVLGYNRRVEAILYASDCALRAALSQAAYSHLITWIEARWPYEVRQHGLAGRAAARRDGAGWEGTAPGLACGGHSGKFGLAEWICRARAGAFGGWGWAPGVSPDAPRAAAPRTYRIFATHYEAKKGAAVVALPDQCLKLANGGLHTCDDRGYTPGAGYSIVLRYKESAGVVVGESGPWNIDDNFWATLGDPTPRRLFADLPPGMPEAQAAFYDGYNGGVDQFGRKVTAPFAIDLSRPVGEQIGLPWGHNDWVTVSFLWTAEWGDASAPAGGSGNAAVQPVSLASPAADGSITHEVRPGETLWSIAVSYGVTIAGLRSLNGLGESTVITPGQKLRVKPAGPTWTPDPTRQAQVTSAPGASATPLLSELPLPARRTEKAIRQTARAATAQSVPVSATPPATPLALALTRQPISPGPQATAGAAPDDPSRSLFSAGPALLLAIALVLLGGGCLAWLAGKFWRRK